MEAQNLSLSGSHGSDRCILVPSRHRISRVTRWRRRAKVQRCAALTTSHERSFEDEATLFQALLPLELTSESWNAPVRCPQRRPPQLISCFQEGTLSHRRQPHLAWAAFSTCLPSPWRRGSWVLAATKEPCLLHPGVHREHAQADYSKPNNNSRTFIRLLRVKGETQSR